MTEELEHRLDTKQCGAVRRLARALCNAQSQLLKHWFVPPLNRRTAGHVWRRAHVADFLFRMGGPVVCDPTNRQERGKRKGN